MQPAVQVVTPPSSEPVTAAELAAHLKLNTGTSEYADLAGFITAARELFEQHTGRAVLPTAFRQYLPTLAGPVELLRGPVTAVAEVGYVDAAGDDQELDGWELDAAAIPAVVYVPDGAYPAVSATRRRPAWVDFTAGWANAAAVPKAVATAIKLMAGHWYRFREAYTEVPLRDLPSGFQTIVGTWNTGLTTRA